LKPSDKAVPEAAAAEAEPDLEASKIMVGEVAEVVVALAPPDIVDFDGLFSLMTEDDGNVAAAAAAWDADPVDNAVEADAEDVVALSPSEQLLDGERSTDDPVDEGE
jgi:hypothetical protein